MPEPDPETDTVVQTESLVFRYGDRVALDGVSLQVRAGEVFGLLGPNGSGKTTLFRILSTLIPPTDGVARLLGLDVVSQREAVRRQIGVVFQSPSLDIQLSAEENLRHHGHLYGLRGRELRGRIEQTLRALGIWERRHERVKAFSGGMRRRVELAKGLLTQPRLLILDEPSTGLDPAARIDLWEFLQRIRHEQGVTVLLTTHLMDEADRCDRLAILRQGKVLACDAPTALKQVVGGDVITMTSSDPAALRSALADKLDLEVKDVDGTLRIERHQAHRFVPQLIESAPGLIDTVSVGRPTLEDVFVHLTGHRFERAEEPGSSATKRQRRTNDAAAASPPTD